MQVEKIYHEGGAAFVKDKGEGRQKLYGLEASESGKYNLRKNETMTRVGNE